MKKYVFGSIVIILLLAATFFIVQASTIFSTSINMDGTAGSWYSPGVFSPFATFSWRVDGTPGYDVDWNAQGWGYVTIDYHGQRSYGYVGNYWWSSPDRKYYFETRVPDWVCGKSNISLTPWLKIYNSNTNAHDTIYGYTISTNVYAQDCRQTMLPTIRKNSSGGRMPVKLSPYPPPPTPYP